MHGAIRNLRRAAKLEFREGDRVRLRPRKKADIKYPTIFHGADAAVITKMDLAAAVEFEGEAAHRNIERVYPGIRVFEVSTKSGAGMEEVLQWTTSLRGAAAGLL